MPHQGVGTVNMTRWVTNTPILEIIPIFVSFRLPTLNTGCGTADLPPIGTWMHSDACIDGIQALSDFMLDEEEVPAKFGGLRSLLERT